MGHGQGAGKGPEVEACLVRLRNSVHVTRAEGVGSAGVAEGREGPAPDGVGLCGPGRT